MKRECNKRLISSIIAGIIALSLLLSMPLSFAAKSTVSKTNQPYKIISETKEQHANGISITIIIGELYQNQVYSNTYNKSGFKSYVARNKEGKELWRFTVNGTFSIHPGESSVCTSSSYNIKITEDSWKMEKASTRKTGNKAIGDATFIKKLLLITVERKNCSVTLSCDKNGNLY